MKDSKYVLFVKKNFNGLPEYHWFLDNERHIIIYGNSRKSAYFTCASCGDNCVCCEGAKIFNFQGIVEHVNTFHLK